MQRLHVIVHGHVQGVGFRYFVCREALRLEIAGWVRNLADGSVEIEAEGDAAALAAFDTVVRRGSPGARVTACDHEWSDGPPRHRRFSIAG